MDIRIGNGYDVHALAPGLPMWLGGVRIPSDTGFVAHSDGDVAIHALCDALLGCLALGDIGHLFPDTSDEWKGVDSKLLLEKVVVSGILGVSVDRVSVKATTTEHLGFVGRCEGCQVWATALITK